MVFSIRIDGMCPFGKKMPCWNMQVRNMQGHRKAVFSAPLWWQCLIKGYLLQDCVTEKKSSTDFFVVVVCFKTSRVIEPLHSTAR